MIKRKNRQKWEERLNEMSRRELLEEFELLFPPSHPVYVLSYFLLCIVVFIKNITGAVNGMLDTIQMSCQGKIGL